MDQHEHAKSLRALASEIDERAEAAQSRANVAEHEADEAQTERARAAHQREQVVHQEAADHQHAIAAGVRELAEREES